MRFYSKHVNGVLSKLLVQQNTDPAPTDCIEISEDDYKSLSITQSIVDLKTSAYAMIDQKAGEVRLRFITSVPGQSETYLMKAEDAKAIIALNYQVNINDYPMVKAEMDATGIQDVPTICNGILYTLGQWRNVAAIIERERRSAKISIAGSTDANYIISERDSAIASLDSIQ